MLSCLPYSSRQTPALSVSLSSLFSLYVTQKNAPLLLVFLLYFPWFFVLSPFPWSGRKWSWTESCIGGRRRKSSSFVMFWPCLCLSCPLLHLSTMKKVFFSSLFLLCCSSHRVLFFLVISPAVIYNFCSVVFGSNLKTHFRASFGSLKRVRIFINTLLVFCELSV